MADIDQLLKPLILKDLREQLRARGCNPGGGVEDLRLRLKEHMQASGDYSTKFGTAGAPPPAAAPTQAPSVGYQQGSAADFYRQPVDHYQGPNEGVQSMNDIGGQRNSFDKQPSRGHQVPPGGSSQIVFGGPEEPGQDAALHNLIAGARPLYGGGPPAPAAAPPAARQSDKAKKGGSTIEDKPSQKNNYARPGGNQNLGNKITDRPTSRVLAPPGGKSQISFG